MENNKLNNEVKITNIMVTRVLMGLNELSRLDITDFDVNYGIAKLVKKLSPIEIAYNKTKKALMDENIPITENGTYEIDGNKMYVYKSINHRDKYFKEITELNDKVVIDKIDFSIKASFLKNLKGLKAETMVKLNELIEYDI